MTAEGFIAKWDKVDLTERSAAQAHFLDLCELVGHPKPQEADPKGEWFTFERGASKQRGGDGWADVWKKDFFGWEYKGRHKDLGAAYDQLTERRLAPTRSGRYWPSISWRYCAARRADQRIWPNLRVS
jgi:hypothetical protein